jgi:DNA-binding response OmpR family regulator
MYQLSYRPGESSLTGADGATTWRVSHSEASTWTMPDYHERCEHPLIAIVEDDSATVEMLSDLLAMSGYRTLQISRGETAYPAIRAAQPQLILLDLWLEHHDAGSMAVGLLSIDPATAHIPIVLCSAQVAALRSRNDQVLRKVAGVVEKPFAIDELLMTIQAALAGSTFVPAKGS